MIGSQLGERHRCPAAAGCSSSVWRRRIWAGLAAVGALQHGLDDRRRRARPPAPELRHQAGQGAGVPRRCSASGSACRRSPPTWPRSSTSAGSPAPSASPARSSSTPLLLLMTFSVLPARRRPWRAAAARRAGRRRRCSSLLQLLASFIVRRFLDGASDIYGTFAVGHRPAQLVPPRQPRDPDVGRAQRGARRRPVAAPAARRHAARPTPTGGRSCSTSSGSSATRSSATPSPWTVGVATDGAAAGVRRQVVTSKWPARPLISSRRCTGALGARRASARPSVAPRPVGLDERAQTGGVDERDRRPGRSRRRRARRPGGRPGPAWCSCRSRHSAPAHRRRRASGPGGRPPSTCGAP